MSIKKGYQVQITSWENDADNYRTEVISGLSKEKARMYLELAKFFESGTNNGAVGPDGRGNYGNADIARYDDPDSHGKCGYRNHFNSLIFVREFKDFCEKNGIYMDEDFHEDTYYDLIGTWCDGEYVRVFESSKVFYFPEDVNEVPLSDILGAE